MSSGIILNTGEYNANVAPNLIDASKKVKRAKNKANDLSSNIPGVFPKKGDCYTVASNISTLEVNIGALLEKLNSAIEYAISIENGDSVQITREEYNFFQRTGASFVNGVIAFGNGLLEVGEGIVDAGVILYSSFGTALTGLDDIATGLSTGDWSFKSTKRLWDTTKATVAYDFSSDVLNSIYDSKFGRALDAAAYDSFKSTGAGFQVCKQFGTLAGEIGLAFVPGGTALIGLSATGRYTEENWNNNSVILAVDGGEELGLRVSYEDIKQIQLLQNRKEEKSVTIGYYTYTTDGNGNITVSDPIGNTYSVESTTESSTVRGLVSGVLHGAAEAGFFKAGSAIEGIEVAKSASPVVNQLVNSGVRVAANSGLGGGTVFVESGLDAIGNNVSLSEAFQENGGWDAVKTNTITAAGVTGLFEAPKIFNTIKVSTPKALMNTKYERADTGLKNNENKFKEALDPNYKKVPKKTEEVVENVTEHVDEAVEASSKESTSIFKRIRDKFKNNVDEKSVKTTDDSIYDIGIPNKPESATTKSVPMEEAVEKDSLKYRKFLGIEDAPAGVTNNIDEAVEASSKESTSIFKRMRDKFKNNVDEKPLQSADDLASKSVTTEKSVENVVEHIDDAVETSAKGSTDGILKSKTALSDEEATKATAGLYSNIEKASSKVDDGIAAASKGGESMSSKAAEVANASKIGDVVENAAEHVDDAIEAKPSLFKRLINKSEKETKPSLSELKTLSEEEAAKATGGLYVTYEEAASKFDDGIAAPSTASGRPIKNADNPIYNIGTPNKPDPVQTKSFPKAEYYESQAKAWEKVEVVNPVSKDTEAVAESVEAAKEGFFGKLDDGLSSFKTKISENAQKAENLIDNAPGGVRTAAAVGSANILSGLINNTRDNANNDIIASMIANQAITPAVSTVDTPASSLVEASPSIEPSSGSPYYGGGRGYTPQPKSETKTEPEPEVKPDPEVQEETKPEEKLLYPGREEIINNPYGTKAKQSSNSGNNKQNNNIPIEDNANDVAPLEGVDTLLYEDNIEFTIPEKNEKIDTLLYEDNIEFNTDDIEFLDDEPSNKKGNVGKTIAGVLGVGATLAGAAVAGTQYYKKLKEDSNENEGNNDNDSY